MATLIPNVSKTDFFKLKVNELKDIKSCEIYADGQYLGTWINAPSSYLRSVAEYKGQLCNAVKGKTIEEIKGAVAV